MDHIVSDRRGIVTPEYRAEHERVGDDNVITNNKTYGTAKLVQPQVIIMCLLAYFDNTVKYSRHRSVCDVYTFFVIFVYFNSRMARRFKRAPARISRAR